MTVIAWPEIEAFHNIRKYAAAHPEILNGQSVVRYKCKIKLHGTNAAIQCHQDGRVIPQSRTAELTVEKDNAGFARWVEDNKKSWTLLNNHVVYGEWIGKGIQKGVACSSISKKSFAVFAVRSMENPETLFVEPFDLEHVVDGIPDTYVIPWYERMSDQLFDQVAGDPERMLDWAMVSIDWSKPNEELTKEAERINQWVSEVEANDPWIESMFGIKGTGEGLVFYPVSEAHRGYTNFSNLVFKAKGEAHKTVATAKPAQVSPEAAANIEAFACMVLTVARLEQGANTAALTQGTFDMKLMGKFITWVCADVQKECQDELEASGLEWKQVQKTVSDKARAWYIAKFKET